ncbi:MAG: hypothetical protein K5897_03075, partial [Eubacterium sp.]|nr:hypothetical protein [Eubacterium sp.]
APLFDHGAGLLSDTKMDYPMGQDPVLLVSKARPKTFCDSFTEQLDIAEEMYGRPLSLFHRTGKTCYDNNTDATLKKRG